MSERKGCEAPSCAESVARGMLMCRAHWFAVPAPIRSDVLRTWKLVQRVGSYGAWVDYFDARNAAIASVTP